MSDIPQTTYETQQSESVNMAGNPAHEISCNETNGAKPAPKCRKEIRANSQIFPARVSSLARTTTQRTTHNARKKSINPRQNAEYQNQGYILRYAWHISACETWPE